MWLPIWLLWTTTLYLVPFSRYSTSVFRVWPWPLNPKGYLGSKNVRPFESPYMTSYLTSMDNISLSRTVFEIFDFKVLKVWPWPLTPRGQLGSKKLYRSKAHIWLSIWLLYGQHLSISYRFRDIRLQSFQGLTLTFDLLRSSGVNNFYTILKPVYDFLFDFYGQQLSISYRFRDIRRQFLGFDLDLWTLKVIWGQKMSDHSKAHIWLAIWLLWTTSLYLVPFSRYSTSKFSGFDFDLWPLEGNWGRKKLYRLKAHIWLPIWLLYGQHLSISYRFWDIRLQSFQGLTLTLTP